MFCRKQRLPPAWLVTSSGWVWGAPASEPSSAPVRRSTCPARLRFLMSPPKCLSVLCEDTADVFFSESPRWPCTFICDTRVSMGWTRDWAPRSSSVSRALQGALSAGKKWSLIGGLKGSGWLLSPGPRALICDVCWVHGVYLYLDAMRILRTGFFPVASTTTPSLLLA